MGENLDVNLILHKLNKYQTKLEQGGDLDIYRQKIQFYYEQLGGGCSRVFGWSNKDKLAYYNTITHFRDKAHPESIQYRVCENILKIKNYSTICRLWQKLSSLLTSHPPLNQDNYKDIDQEINTILSTQ